MREKLGKDKQVVLFAACGITSVFLLITGVFLGSRAQNFKNNGLKITAMIHKDFSGLNSVTITQLERHIDQLKLQLVGLALQFIPGAGAIKEGYDPAIYFAEELDKANQDLRRKSQEKKTVFTDLGFQEKLPSDREAHYLLNQLYGLKEVVSLGLDYGVNFKSITPLGAEKTEALAGVKEARSRLEFACPAKTLPEFLIALTDIVPSVSLDSLLLSDQEGVFAGDAVLRHTIVDLTAWGVQPEYAAGNKQLVYVPSATQEQKDAMRVLRSANPFVPPRRNDQEIQVKGPGGQSQPLPRLLYKGKAVLAGKDVVVIEDTLSQETLFLSRQERIGNFMVQDFTDERVRLKNLEDSQELVIERQVDK